ncbi:MAG: DUF4402 domain-containing protein [Gammaproteobacteria bacterium]|jgi:hypothetical protein
MKINLTTTPYLSVLSILLLTGFLTVPAFAASAQATVSVKVVRHITVTNKANMSFGHLSVGETAGAVVLGQDGSRNPTGGVILETGGSSTPASFTATGEPNTSFAVTLPEFITMTDSGGNAMTVDSFNSTAGNTGKFDDTGKQELNVGATLRVNANQALGNYTGSMNISINYN